MTVHLIKYADQHSETYSYFWTHRFRDEDVDRVVSPTFYSEEEAVDWGRKLRCEADDTQTEYTNIIKGSLDTPQVTIDGMHCNDICPFLELRDDRLSECDFYCSHLDQKLYYSDGPLAQCEKGLHWVDEPEKTNKL